MKKQARKNPAKWRGLVYLPAMRAAHRCFQSDEAWTNDIPRARSPAMMPGTAATEVAWMSCISTISSECTLTATLVTRPALR